MVFISMLSEQVKALLRYPSTPVSGRAGILVGFIDLDLSLLIRRPNIFTSGSSSCETRGLQFCGARSAYSSGWGHPMVNFALFHSTMQ